MYCLRILYVMFFQANILNSWVVNWLIQKLKLFSIIYKTWVIPISFGYRVYGTLLFLGCLDRPRKYWRRLGPELSRASATTLSPFYFIFYFSSKRAKKIFFPLSNMPGTYYYCTVVAWEGEKEGGGYNKAQQSRHSVRGYCGPWIAVHCCQPGFFPIWLPI